MTRYAALVIGLVAGLPLSAMAQDEKPVRYDGHKALRVTAENLRQYQTIMALTDDVLTCEGSGVGTFDVRMTPEQYTAFIETGIVHQVLVPDVQAHVEQIWAEDAEIRRGGLAGDDPSWFVTYRSLAEIETRLAALAAQFPDLATPSVIGNSVLSRPIRMLRITGPGPTTNRPAIVIQANQHAREWITPMAAMYIIDRLLETYSTDNRIKTIVDNIDFYIIPCVNPDGYEYSRTTNSQWRKNRRTNTGTSCRGVDLNRNWGYQWGYDNEGSSPNPCSDTFRGPSAFSESELAGIKTVLDGLAAENRLKVHWDIHTNGQMLLSPWGYTINPPPAHLPLMDELGELMSDAMFTVRGTNYPYGQGSVILYFSNGAARDYSYGALGGLSWTIELSGSSFQPNVSQILPNCQEALAGLLPLAEYFIVTGPVCYANCDQSTQAPVLNVADFACFLTRFAAQDPYANCDQSTSEPILNVADFGCFLQRFAAGCE